MNTEQFFNKLLPSRGNRAVFVDFDGKPRNIFRQTNKELADLALKLDSVNNQDVYFALASYKLSKKRTHDNALLVRCFWLDVDCGKGKPYATAKQGVKALVEFIKKSGLPAPMIVSSGRGLHVYWPMLSDIPAGIWTKIATRLKAVVKFYDFKADPSRTSDVSSVLRPIGTHNRKKEPLQVKLLKDTKPLDVKAFLLTLNKIITKHRIEVKDVRATKKKSSGLNAALGHVREDKPVDVNLVADKCAHVGQLRDTRGDIEEPLWYAALGVVNQCVDGKRWGHKWSKGHPEYSKSETNRKLEQLDKVGPTTCARFEELDDTLCAGCPFKGKVTSPIQLGVKIKELPPPVDTKLKVTLPATPDGFKRAKDGLYYIVPETDTPVKFFDHDVYPVCLLRDDMLKYDEVLIRFKKPIDGWVEFKARLSDLTDNKRSNEVYGDNGMLLETLDKRRIMSHYLINFAKELQKQSATVKLSPNMGWDSDIKNFTIGNRLYKADEETQVVNVMSEHARHTAEMFEMRGSLETWTMTADLFDKAGMEPMAFALCAGFGAPLMKFIGLEGCLINLVGKSGVGKTLTQRMINSIYGNPSLMAQSHEDTDNAKFKHAALMGNLPITIDEITNIDPQRLSDFVYRITQGRDRNRLRRDGTYNTHVGQWSTLIISSTNESLINKLTAVKFSPEAEIMRVFETSVYHVDDDWGMQVATSIRDNFGLAGDVYINYIVKNRNSVAKALKAQFKKFMDSRNYTGAERYRVAAMTCALIGGALAKKLGLMHLNLNRLKDWVIDQSFDVRDSTNNMMSGPVDILAEYLASRVQNMLVIGGDNAKRGLGAHIKQEPRRELTVRVDEGKRKLLISSKDFNDFVDNKHGNRTEIRNFFADNGMFVDEPKVTRMRLGTGYIKAPPTWVYALKLDHPMLNEIEELDEMLGGPKLVVDNSEKDDA